MTKSNKNETGLGAMHEISISGSVGFENSVIASTIHRPGLEPETLIYLRDTPISNILKESGNLAGLDLTEVEIEETQDKVKRTGFPIKVEGGLSKGGAYFELDLKAREEIKTSRRVKIRYSK